MRNRCSKRERALAGVRQPPTGRSSYRPVLLGPAPGLEPAGARSPVHLYQNNERCQIQEVETIHFLDIQNSQRLWSHVSNGVITESNSTGFSAERGGLPPTGSSRGSGRSVTPSRSSSSSSAPAVSGPPRPLGAGAAAGVELMFLGGSGRGLPAGAGAGGGLAVPGGLLAVLAGPLAGVPFDSSGALGFSSSSSSSSSSESMRLTRLRMGRSSSEESSESSERSSSDARRRFSTSRRRRESSSEESAGLLRRPDSSSESLEKLAVKRKQPLTHCPTNPTAAAAPNGEDSDAHQRLGLTVLSLDPSAVQKPGQNRVPITAGPLL
ncbi:unnamed protein product [Menidia menidia]|uniref:(Atlantic silverside) hypothetical protein n=1 Tax=Menidia menidia TaxID=238744 RepID=A0A8S4AGY9_9TELE|nr:unnamed protein product [Menidia menidia]